MQRVLICSSVALGNWFWSNTVFKGKYLMFFNILYSLLKFSVWFWIYFLDLILDFIIYLLNGSTLIKLLFHLFVIFFDY